MLLVKGKPCTFRRPQTRPIPSPTPFENSETYGEKVYDKKDALNTRPVSSTLPPTAVPEMRDSKIEDTSEAATRVHGSEVSSLKKDKELKQEAVNAPGFAVAYERAITGLVLWKKDSWKTVEYTKEV